MGAGVDVGVGAEARQLVGLAGGFGGATSDIEIQAREIIKMRERLNKLMAKHTGKKVDTIAKDTDRDNFMTSEEAKKYGLIDEVLEQRPKPADEKGKK